LRIEIAVLEDGPHRDELRQLVLRVQTLFDRR
jgi:hypothetical protein